jgi:hypothetical protein
MSAAEKYREALASCPAPGNGRHKWMMGTANLAAFAGVAADEAERDMVDALGPRGRERVGEVRATLSKAYREHGARAIGTFGTLPRRMPPQPPDPDKFLSYVEAGAGFQEGDLWEASPVRLTWEPGWVDAAAFVRNLFLPEDWIFCAEDRHTRGILGQSVRRREEWVEEFRRRGRANLPLPLFIMPNPVSPTPSKTRDGKESLRADASVVAFRNLVVEHDAAPFEMQLAFWAGWCAERGWKRIRAMVHTGGKSIHVLYSVDAAGREDWERRVREGYVKRTFGPMGFDMASQHPSHMTRLPGAVRTDGTTDGEPTVQKLLFLNEALR